MVKERIILARKKSDSGPAQTTSGGRDVDDVPPGSHGYGLVVDSVQKTQHSGGGKA